jgi:hypothetical protein
MTAFNKINLSLSGKREMLLKKSVAIVAILMLVITTHMVLFSTPAIATNEFDVYLKAESFTWKEFNDSGARLLKESGPIYGVGLSVKSDDIYKLLTLKAKGELFGGSVDYDGQTQAGTPVKTDTDYLGFKIETDGGWKFILKEKSSLEPFAGLGFRWWIRDLKSTSSAIGYEEKWWSFYARLGIHGDHIFSNQLKAFVNAGVKLPIHNENKADLRVIGLSTVTLEPGKEASVFAELGLKWKMLKASVFYEDMRFSKSDIVRIGSAQVWQPESKADIFGLNVGLAS